MFHFVQNKVQGFAGYEGDIQRCKKEAEKYEDKVKQKEEAVKSLKKKKEQYEGES